MDILEIPETIFKVILHFIWIMFGIFHTETENITTDKKANRICENIIPVSVNYHFTRKCNYQCGFCFHTAKTSYMLNLQDAKRGLEMLKAAGKLFFILFLLFMIKLTGIVDNINYLLFIFN